MSGYTKGPWTAFTQESFSGWWSVEDSEGNEVGSGDGGFYEDDARLIAAAPDIYEALQSIVLHANPSLFSAGQLEQARAAIAKAKGTAQ